VDGTTGRYRVRRGDTLTQLAARDPRRSVTVASLAKRNHVANPNLIYVGQILLTG
jgi:LysM repeat protein